jgi:hypothetical protein
MKNYIIQDREAGNEIELFSNLKSFYIEFLNKKKGYSKDVAYFETYDKAISWGREFLENFNSDMIKISL